MNWLERLLARLFEHFDIVKNIDGVDSVYLRRFYLFKSKRFNVFLHHIMRSDDDPDPHDHPWQFWALILKGGYVNEGWRFSPNGRADFVLPPVQLPDHLNLPMPMQIYGTRQKLPDQRVRVGQIVHRAANHVHRVILEDGKPSWSLVVTGRDDRDWGFVKNDRWIFWRAYLNNWSVDPKDFA